MTDSPHLSVVVPFYNEEQSIRPLHTALVTALATLGRPYEMVFVDDGSADQTFQIAVDIAREDPRVRVVRFRRNYGQTAAMAAGIEYSTGEIIVTMDGDLQNDPADIGAFLGKMDEGYDIVVGWRFNRQDKLISRKIPSRIANRLIARVTGVPIRDNGCSLKAYRAKLIKQIPLYSEMHRFIPAVASIAGPRIAEIKVRHHARQFGKSKYGLSRVYKVLLDLLVIKTVTSFISKPVKWFGLLSLPVLILSMAAMLWTGYALVFQGRPIPWPIAGSGVILLSSTIIMIGNGMLGELIYKTSRIRDYEFTRLTRQIHDSGTQAQGALPR
jgi:glycosyltransferase involved in cell wall biosynthesis